MLVPLIVAVAAGAAATPCPVKPLPQPVLQRSALEVERFEWLQEQERAPGLMGFRAGPRLEPPTRNERHLIAAARSERRQLGLNPSRLLVRRLMRDHSARSRRFQGTKVTTIEARDLRFRERVEDTTPEIGRYGDRCARDTYAGLYFDPDRPWPARYRIVLRFTGPLGPHRRALRTRARYHHLLPVRGARHSLRELQALEERVVADLEDWKRQGYRLNSVVLDARRNAVVVGIENPSRQARDAFRERYGSGVVLQGIVIEK